MVNLRESIVAILKKIGTGIAIFLVLIVVLVIVQQPIPLPFNSEQWKNCQQHSERYQMHTDFLRHHHVVGMSRDELVELLGKPDTDSAKELSWDFGQYFGADDSAIDFKLKDGKVVSYNVWGW